MSTVILTQPITLQFLAELTAIITPESESGGFSAEVPALPGCFSQGETMEEVIANLREVAEGWLAVAHEDALAQASE